MYPPPLHLHSRTQSLSELNFWIREVKVFTNSTSCISTTCRIKQDFVFGIRYWFLQWRAQGIHSANIGSKSSPPLTWSSPSSLTMISSSWGRAKTTAFFPRYSLAPLRMASQCLSERFWIDALKMLACFVSFRFFFPSASTVSVGMLPQFTWEKWDSFPPFGAFNSPVTENKSVRWTCNKFFQVSYGSGNESTSTLTAWTAYIKAPWGFMEIVWMSSTSTVDMSARWSASVLRTIRQRNKRDGERRKTRLKFIWPILCCRIWKPLGLVRRLPEKWAALVKLIALTEHMRDKFCTLFFRYEITLLIFCVQRLNSTSRKPVDPIWNTTIHLKRLSEWRTTEWGSVWEPHSTLKTPRFPSRIQRNGMV